MPLVQLHIVDLGNEGPNTYIRNTAVEGWAGQNINAEFSTKVKYGASSSIPMAFRGLSRSVFSSPYIIADPALETLINNIPERNNDWSSSPQLAKITALGLSPTYAEESVNFGYPNVVGTHKVNLISEAGYYDTHSRGRIELIEATGSAYWESQTLRSGTTPAWLSYDVRTGVNSKSIFGYSLSMVDNISGSGLVINPEPNRASELLGYSGLLHSGYCNMLNFIIGNSGMRCQLPENTPDEYEICLPTGLTSGELKDAIQAIINKFQSYETGAGVTIGSNTNDSVVNNGKTIQYTVYEGQIAFNSPILPDKFRFLSYAFDYSGRYLATYGVNPPYPPIDKTWAWGGDYNTAEDLSSLIVSELYNNSHWLWHPDICNDTNKSGYFEYGPLLNAHINADDSNIIDIQSTRPGSAGLYAMSFINGPRPPTKPTLNIAKYMLPNKATLQGSNNNSSWTNIDTRSPIEWGKIPPKLVPRDFYTNPTGEAETYEDDGPDELDIDISGGLVPKLVYEAFISGHNRCSGEFRKKVSFYEMPTGFKCKDKDDPFSGVLEDLKDGEPKPQAKSFASILKTGWKFPPVTYDYYRVYLENFNSESRGLDVDTSGEFIVANINLYGTITGFAPQTGLACLLGASYSLFINGLTTGLLTNSLYKNLSESDSGVYSVNNHRVVGTPNGNGLVYFRNHIGRAVTPFTGLVTSQVYGTGFYVAPVYGHYYDNLTSTVSFSKNVSGLITGYGMLTGGPYTLITEEARDRVLGSLTQRVTGIGSGILKGLSPNFTYLFDDLEGFGYLSGTLTGIVTQGGSMVFDRDIIGYPGIVYQNRSTGSIRAGATLFYSNPQSGNGISINGFPITYADSPNLGAPSYFHNQNELTTIINSGMDTFGVSGRQVGSTIYLTAVGLGESGNGIPIFPFGPDGGIYSNTTGTRGGVTYYAPMTANEPFTLPVYQEVFATGLYTGYGLGYVTGLIKQLEFVRSFTGVWGLQTGDFDFNANNWVQGFKYSNFNVYTGISYNTAATIPIEISYRNDPLVITQDIARLTITGTNIQSGVYLLLTGEL